MSRRGPNFTACDNCYRRKIRCDSGRPCDWCLHQQSDCTYLRARPRSRKQNTAKRFGSVERITRIDERKVSDSRNIVECPRSTPLTTPPRIIYFAGREFGNVQNGVPNLLPEGLQWIWSQTGHPVSFTASQQEPWKMPRITTLPLTETTPELPNEQLLESFLAVYISSPMHRIFPVVEPDLFSETIQAAYSHANTAHVQNHGAQACILTFMAMVSSLHHLDPSYSGAKLPSIPRDAYIAHASLLLTAIIQQPLNLDTLQTAISLALISVLTGDIQTAVNYTSIASRLLIAAGGLTLSDDLNNNSTPPSTIRQHLRTLFWFCYTIDRDLALRTGQPHCFSDDDCMLDVPSKYEENLHLCLDYSPTTADSNIGGPIFLCDLRLSKIKSRTFLALYSHRAFQKPDIDLLCSIRELDKELECWRVSLPEALRPQLSFAPAQSKPKNTYAVLMHMNYYSCANLIHLAIGRCSAWRSGSPQAKEILNGLHSSLAISVEASRSLLLLLDDSKTRINAASFWSLHFYLMSAVITIFGNLLHEIHADSATYDLNLLALAESTTAHLFRRRDGAFDRVSDFQLATESISTLRQHAQRVIFGQTQM